MALTLGTLLRSAVGFLTGGPVGAVAGAVPDLVGGGGANASPAPTQTSAVGMGPLQAHLEQRAFLDGMAGAQPQSYGGLFASLGQRRDQRANQRGGTAYSPSEGYVGTLGPGRGGGTPTDGGPLPSATYSPPGFGNLYLAYLQRALSGQGGLPADAYASAMSHGLATLNAQANRARANLEQTLGSRGLLRSGLFGQGLGSIESARLQGLSNYIADMQQRNLEAARNEADRAAALYAAERQQAFQNQAQMNLLNRQIQAAEPAWWEPFANLASAYVAYRNRPTAASATQQSNRSGFVQYLPGQGFVG